MAEKNYKKLGKKYSISSNGLSCSFDDGDEIEYGDEGPYILNHGEAYVYSLVFLDENDEIGFDSASVEKELNCDVDEILLDLFGFTRIS